MAKGGWLLAVATFLLFLSACAQVPVEPNSPYFKRLIAAAETNNNAPVELLEPRSSRHESSIIQDLIGDGFEPQTGSGESRHRLGHIVCEGISLVRVSGEGETPTYFVRLLWGGPLTLPPFTVFGIDVYRDESCAVTRIVGAKRLQAI
ncbi:MAG: hypothetical protein ACI9GK_000663 [Devosia sp.]|jgi:hypothetical protein|tara:strand:- start:27 stop:470 length:444 start_codon:yes stop_codon:yes gene_type:complete